MLQRRRRTKIPKSQNRFALMVYLNAKVMFKLSSFPLLEVG